MNLDTDGDSFDCDGDGNISWMSFRIHLTESKTYGKYLERSSYRFLPE